MQKSGLEEQKISGFPEILAMGFKIWFLFRSELKAITMRRLQIIMKSYVY